jgi:threonine/homoserine efflux transporter RhtA
MDMSFAAIPALGVGAVWIAMAIVHIVFATAVHHDAEKLQSAGAEPALLNPMMWALITLVTGLTGAAFYWVANRSTLSRSSSN